MNKMRAHTTGMMRVDARCDASAVIVISQDHVPGRIQYLRVYELVPDMNEPAMMVLRDALLANQQAHADAIIREYGLAGCWLPSTIITYLEDAGSGRIIAMDMPAHALWDVWLGYSVYANSAFRIKLDNDMDIPRVCRPVLRVIELTADEINALRTPRPY